MSENTSENPKIEVIYQHKRKMVMHFVECLYDASESLTDPNMLRKVTLTCFSSPRNLIEEFANGSTALLVDSMLEIEKLNAEKKPFIIVVLNDDNSVFAIIPCDRVNY